MIRALLALSGGAQRDRLRGVLALGVAAGVTQGLAILLVVPVLTALLRADLGAAGRALALLAVVVAAHAAVTVVATYAGFTASIGVIRSMHTELGRRLIRLPSSWFGPETTGRASHTAVRGTLFVATAAMDVLVPLVVDVTAPVTVALGALVLDRAVGLALVVAIPVLYGTARLASHWESRGEEAVRRVRAETDLRLLEFTRHQEVLRASGTATGHAPLHAAVERQRLRSRRALWYSVGGMVLQGVVVQDVVAVAAALAVWTATGGGGDPATAVAVIGLVTVAAGPLRAVSSMQTALTQSAAEIDDVRALLETPVLPEPGHPQNFPTTTGIDLADVHFAYDPAEPVLTGVDAHLPDRSVTALVGPSGSGKTTLVRLVARLWDVDAGAVRIGGTDVRELPTAELYRHVSMIFQDVYLFDDTLQANIALGDPEATEDEIRDAARRAHVTEIAERLPHGWDTRVGEGGHLLSGGERQRVSVARALLRRAPLVLCDEPSSALDATSRRAVSAALTELAREATVVVVAHQLETVRDADHILLLDGGRVVAAGTHDHLAATVERYRRFWDLRGDAQRWSLTDGRGTRPAPTPTRGEHQP